VCDANCLTGYGPSPTPNLCVACTYPCLDCNYSATNCTSCNQTNTTYLLFPVSTYVHDCVTSCPVAYFENTTGLSCVSCSNGCIDCTNKTYCYNCNIIAGYLYVPGWSSTTSSCSKPCPSQYYQFNSTNCSYCNTECYKCSYSPSNCSQCQSTGSSRSFLLSSSCF
jgi:proprotein convertase subtilisin/kexin type 5